MNQGMIVQQLEFAYRLMKQGNHDEAEKIGRAVLAQYPHQSDALNLLGQIEERRSQLEKARQFYQRGLKYAPANLQLLNNAGWVERRLKNYRESEDYFKKALKLDPGYYYARQNLAVVYQDQRKLSEAKHQYLEVIRQQPGLVDALANLSNILEQEHELEDARSYAKRALEVDSHHYVARLTLAKIAERNKTYDEVIGLLRPLLQSPQLAPMDRAVIGNKCGHALDKLGDYEGAFALYQAANQLLHKHYEPAVRNPELMYSPAAFSCIEKAIPDFSFSRDSEGVRSPVFLIGFPRSGTTLLDQVLSSHSQITVLEEKPNLAGAISQFPATEEGLKALERASAAQLGKLRRSYWANVERETGATQRTSVIIDKLPLNAFALLHINRIFPGAKIVVALRDPRDCVFSSYQQTFRINPATFQLLRLDSAASLYDQVMSIIMGVYETNAFAMHFIRYEEVIENFAQEVGALIDFLELEWEDTLFDYQVTARSRDVRTPSASQVIQPLYTSSIGKWKHYEQWIGNSFEPLASWVKRWGYPV